MDKQVSEILVEEIRMNRKEIAEVKKELTGLKVTVGMVGAFFGTLGALSVKIWSFFSHK